MLIQPSLGTVSTSTAEAVASPPGGTTIPPSVTRSWRQECSTDTSKVPGGTSSSTRPSPSQTRATELAPGMPRALHQDSGTASRGPLPSAQVTVR